MKRYKKFPKEVRINILSRGEFDHTLFNQGYSVRLISKVSFDNKSGMEVTSLTVPWRKCNAFLRQMRVTEGILGILQNKPFDFSTQDHERGIRPSPFYNSSLEL